MRTPITFTVLALLSLLLAAGCGGKGPREGNYIRPIVLEGCPNDMADGMANDFRSLVAMVASLSAARYEIHKVSPTDFKVFTTFKTVRGFSVAWEAQVYADGSVSLTLPTTTPMQPTKGLSFASDQGERISRYFNKLKCRPAQDLRRRCLRAGYSF